MLIAIILFNIFNAYDYAITLYLLKHYPDNIKEVNPIAK